jgi:hypothetical protein
MCYVLDANVDCDLVRNPQGRVRRAGPHGSASCLRKEDAENTGAGFEHRPQATEGNRAMPNKHIGSSFDDF